MINNLIFSLQHKIPPIPSGKFQLTWYISLSVLVKDLPPRPGYFNPFFRGSIGITCNCTLWLKSNFFHNDTELHVSSFTNQHSILADHYIINRLISNGCYLLQKCLVWYSSPSPPPFPLGGRLPKRTEKNRTPKRYLDAVLLVWLEFFSSHRGTNSKRKNMGTQRVAFPLLHLRFIFKATLHSHFSFITQQKIRHFMKCHFVYRPVKVFFR